jgi:hypothetical protein
MTILSPFYGTFSNMTVNLPFEKRSGKVGNGGDDDGGPMHIASR